MIVRSCPWSCIQHYHGSHIADCWQATPRQGGIRKWQVPTWVSAVSGLHDRCHTRQKNPPWSKALHNQLRLLRRIEWHSIIECLCPTDTIRARSILSASLLQVW